MSDLLPNSSGSVISLWRYPVKSMMGEELAAVEVTRRGLLGDRAYALIDTSTGKVVSAKNPRKWPNLFSFQAAFADDPRANAKVPPVLITLPDGATAGSGQGDLQEVLSSALGRAVTLESMAPESPSLEEYWPDVENLDHRDTVTVESISGGTFFDGASVHVLTTATLEQLGSCYPQGRFEPRRFRPNLLIDPGPGQTGFVENAWVGHTLAVGKEVRLDIARPCPRCVMTTLAQGDLAQDTDILRTAAQENQANVGVYASVLQGGTIRCGDTVEVVD